MTILIIDLLLTFSLIIIGMPIVDARNTPNNKNITYPALQKALYDLTAFLNFRDFFFRLAEDLAVNY